MPTLSDTLVPRQVKSSMKSQQNSIDEGKSPLAFKCADIVRWQRATTVELCQQLLLISYRCRSGGAGHCEGTRTHLEVLAQRLRVIIHIEDAKGPGALTY